MPLFESDDNKKVSSLRVLNLGYQTDEEEKTGAEERHLITSREEKRETDRERETENESEKYVSSIEKRQPPKKRAACVCERNAANIMASETTLEKIANGATNHHHPIDENLRLSSPVFRSEQLVEPFEQVHVRARGVLLSDFAHLRALVLFGLVFVSGHVVSKVQLCEFTRRDTAEGEKRW